MRDKNKHPELMAKIREYYKYNICGGNLHIALDDGNMEDENVEYCRKSALENRDKAGAEIAAGLLSLHFLARYRIYLKRYGAY